MWFSQSEVVLHSNDSKHRNLTNKVWKKKTQMKNAWQKYNVRAGLYLNREAAMLEEVISRKTSLLKSSFIDDGKPNWHKIHFLDIKWNQWLNGQSQIGPHLTNKVCNKETNEKCMAEI